jgi:hypothetical protein
MVLNTVIHFRRSMFATERSIIKWHVNALIGRQKAYTNPSAVKTGVHRGFHVIIVKRSPILQIEQKRATSITIRVEWMLGGYQTTQTRCVNDNV